MIWIALYWFALAVVLAMVEIEIEGKNGWAEKLPTWYRTSGIGKLYGLITGSRPLTGYHLFMNLFLIMVIHLGFINGAAWSLTSELILISRCFIFAFLWDLLWFIMNPEYGIYKFKRTEIWWHSKTKWVCGIFPVDYLAALSVSFALNVVATGIAKDMSILKNHLLFIGSFFVFVFLTIYSIAPAYMRWHKWMQRKDDRDKTGIFHAENAMPIRPPGPTNPSNK